MNEKDRTIKKSSAEDEKKICSRKEILRLAFVKALPVIGSYLFVSMAYGLIMQAAGFGWGWSLFISLTVYTGAFQFVLVTFLSSGASLLTIGVTALFMNSRQFFYGLTFVDEFRKMGKRFPYMVHTMTDETYAVNCTMLPPGTYSDINSDSAPKSEYEEQKRFDIMFFVALFSRLSWMIGAVAGGALGQLIPFELKGIDFCMTALFVTIFIDQWRAAGNHIPAIAGLAVGLILLLVAGADYFLLPTLMLVSGLLLLFQKNIEETGTQRRAGNTE